MEEGSEEWESSESARVEEEIEEDDARLDQSISHPQQSLKLDS